MDRKKLYVWIGVLIIVLAVLSRFMFLDLRVLHHDEGVNYFFTNQMLETGRFVYDPLNYHGPFYFFAIYVSFLLFGISEFSLRLPSVIFGVLLVVLALFIKNRKYDRRIVAMFILLSPSLWYYSRYSIHESSFVFFSLLAVWIFSLIVEKRSLRYLPVFAIVIALLFTIKETVVLLGFVMFVLFLIYFKRIREIKFGKSKWNIFISLLLFLFLFFGFFSSFSNNPDGVVDSVKGFLPWTEKGVGEGGGHVKPFYYYTGLMLMYELPLFLLAFVGCYFVFKYHRKDIFAFNIALWFLLIFVTYSLIPYKTPWLIINMVVPMCFAAGIGFRHLKIGKYKTLLFILILLYLLGVGIFVNFINPNGERGNRFAYVHSQKDILRFDSDLDFMYKDGEKILMVSKKYWPVPYYLHGKNASYLTVDFQGYDFEDYEEFDYFIFDDDEFNEAEVPEGYEYAKYDMWYSLRMVVVRTG